MTVWGELQGVNIEREQEEIEESNLSGLLSKGWH